LKVREQVVIFPDIHFPHEDKKALSCALAVLEYVKPKSFLLLGDFAENEEASHWKYQKVKRPRLEDQLKFIDEELELVNKGLDLIDESCKKAKVKYKICTEGNHEIWLKNLCDEHPYLKRQYMPKIAFKMNERGYAYHPYGKYIKIRNSKLWAYHGGHYNGVNHPRSHLQNLGINVLYGHTHDSMKSVVTHMDGAKMAFSMGCLCNMEKEFLKNRKTNWTHNVGVLDIFSNGNFNLNTLTIINGYTSLNGKVIHGNV